MIRRRGARDAPRRAKRTPLVSLLAVVLATGAVSPTPGSAAPRPTQPSASMFPLEPLGRVPRPGDGLIPNPATPTGRRLTSRPRCTVTFDTATGATATTVNRWIAVHQNHLGAPATLCLAGTFNSPLRIVAKTSTPLLTITRAPGHSAIVDLGAVTGADAVANQYWSVAGAISVVDSRDVAIVGLDVRHVLADGPGLTPAGIDVMVRADVASTDPAVTPHRSACFTHGGACDNIFLLDNVVTDVANLADVHPTRATCGNPDVGAYGIVVLAAGRAGSPALQHVVVEGNTLTDLRTGQSESLSVNGAVSDYLVARNVLGGLDNIGIDAVGWETGPVQPREGLIARNRVTNVDTLVNGAYARWNPTSGRCVARGENAGGIYDDGASRLWIRDNVVWNTNQGISLDVETPGRSTSQLLVTGNDVYDAPGTSLGDPSEGPNPPGVPGHSTVAGHAYDALYLDTYGRGSAMRDVIVTNNVFVNQSQNLLGHATAPVVDLAGNWRDVVIEHNVIGGGGARDRLNPLIVLESPYPGRGLVLDCNRYQGLSAVAGTAFENFATPNVTALSLGAWRAATHDHLDAHSTIGAAPSCAAPHPRSVARMASARPRLNSAHVDRVRRAGDEAGCTSITSRGLPPSRPSRRPQLPLG